MRARAAIPRWLAFPWWWLALASVVLGVLSYKWPNELFGSVLIIWLPVQAAWLKVAAPKSFSVFLLAAGTVGQITSSVITNLEQRDPHFGAVQLWQWTISALELAGCAGTLLFAYELRLYLRRTEGYEPQVSLVWAFLLNVFYFQYKLHELYEDQIYRTSRITPE